MSYSEYPLWAKIVFPLYGIYFCIGMVPRLLPAVVLFVPVYCLVRLFNRKRV